MEARNLKVDAEHDQSRLDVYLAKSLPDVPSRSFVQKLIAEGQVTVNGKKAKANYRVTTDDKVVVELPEEILTLNNIKPESIPLDIIYEDDDILLVNKPAGMLVHPAHGYYSGTLVNALLHHCADLSDYNTAVRPGIVHRLDRETSGIMIVAKNNVAHARLARQFEKHRIQKKYLALVEGSIEFDEGIVDAPLGRHFVHRDKKTVAFHDEAKEATTFYRVLKRFKNATLVALFPRTGRTHQLRVHMAHLGHPILGDDKYGKKEKFPRLALHAQSIGFVHPQNSFHFEFSVVPPPEFLAYR